VTVGGTQSSELSSHMIEAGISHVQWSCDHARREIRRTSVSESNNFYKSLSVTLFPLVRMCSIQYIYGSLIK